MITRTSVIDEDNEKTLEITDQQIISFLERQIDQESEIVPVVDLDTANAYRYPDVETFFDISSEEAVELLEYLAGQNFLDRSLVDRVQLCPECKWHTLNFREVCPVCDSINIGKQEVIHHFACAYMGFWTEFRDGSDLICPKCNETLRNIGMDYEKPSDMYSCNDCEHIFKDPDVQARCFRDDTESAPEDLPLVSVYRYCTNDMTASAVKHQRLNGLDVQSILFNGETRTIRKEFLQFELGREIQRSRRYDADMSLVLFWFDGLESIVSMSQVPDETTLQKELFDSVVDSLRSLDLVCNFNQNMGVLLLPETNLTEAHIVADRIKKEFMEYSEIQRTDQVTITGTVCSISGEEDMTDAETFLETAYNGLLYAVKEQPGSVVKLADVEKDMDEPVNESMNQEVK